MQETVDTTGSETMQPENPKPQGDKRPGRGRKGKAALEKRPQGPKQAYMYLGPNIPGGLMFKGSVYKEIPEHLKDTFEKLPDIKKLLIEVKNVPKFKAEVEQQGSEAHRLYQDVENRLKEGALRDGV